MGNQRGKQLNTLSSDTGEAQNAHLDSPEKHQRRVLGAQGTKQHLVPQGVLRRCHQKKSQAVNDTNKAHGQGFS